MPIRIVKSNVSSVSSFIRGSLRRTPRLSRPKRENFTIDISVAHIQLNRVGDKVKI